MYSSRVLRFVQNYRFITSSKIPKQIESQKKLFSLTPKLLKDPKKQLTELEDRIKKLMTEYAKSVDNSALKPLIERWMSKAWLNFFGLTSKNVPIKERKEVKSLKDGMFRMAFDLPGFKAEDIHVIVSDNKLYIEAKKEETTTDGMKAWREFSFQCNLDQNVNTNSITAQLDSEGLLVIDGDIAKESLSGVKKGNQ